MASIEPAGSQGAGTGTLDLLWIVPFLGFCAVLMPIDATYGVALAQVGAAGVIGSTMALLDGHYGTRRRSTGAASVWRS